MQVPPTQFATVRGFRYERVIVNGKYTGETKSILLLSVSSDAKSTVELKVSEVELKKLLAHLACQECGGYLRGAGNTDPIEVPYTTTDEPDKEKYFLVCSESCEEALHNKMCSA